jgi:lipoyl(octanoyl) transferase
MKTWRVLDTGARPGPLNMAIDQAILAMHARGESPPTLRLYRWNPPAVSLGYFQRRHGIDLGACRRLGIDVVRRPTGGRAVLHLNDVTYAIVAGTGDGIPSSVATAYHLICEGLLAAFRILGFEAEPGRHGAGSPRSDLCFLTSTAADLLHKGRKFVGSAQAWQGSSMLQHGSIVLEPQTRTLSTLQRSGHSIPAASEDGLEQRTASVSGILGRVPGPDEMAAAIRHGMALAMKVSFMEGQLSAEEWALAREIRDRSIEV